jgi:hypothetical protein
MPAQAVTDATRKASSFPAGLHVAPSGLSGEVDTSGSASYNPRMTEGAATVNLPVDWLDEFEAAARRPLPIRWKYAFIHTYKPILDDASYRSFDTMEEYRRWCEQNLPDWLGYARI